MKDIQGWILIDKPNGISSAGVTNFIKKILRLSNCRAKVGHAGTLDVAASGLLLVAIGEATKTMQYAMNLGKEYIFSITWGENRDTLDSEGKITATSDMRPSREMIESVLPTFYGEIEQLPPKYSALNINGKRAYDLARSGAEFVIQPRKTNVYNLELISNSLNEATFKVACSKGFYVRSLARDIAEKLGACGFVSFLHRTKINNFSIDNAISLAILEKLWHSTESGSATQKIIKCLLPIYSVLDDILVQNITPVQSEKLCCGQSIPAEINAKEGEIVAIFCNSILKAIAAMESGLLKPQRVFNQSI